MSDDAKKIVLGGEEALVVGDVDDPYFRAVEGQAAGLNGFANFVRAGAQGNVAALDVGANIGLSTLILARHFKTVIAFEPSPINFAFLEQNLRLNKIANVQLHRAAVSDVSRTVRFHVAQFGAGSHVIGGGHVLSASIPAIDVPAIPLDELNLPPVGPVKIDVEGHEPDVLAGGRKFLARDRPLIFTEINAWCLSAFAGYSLGTFVGKLWEAFDVSVPGLDGVVSPSMDPYAFLHDLITHRGGVADIVLRPKRQVPLPDLRELTWPKSALDAISGELRRSDG